MRKALVAGIALATLGLAACGTKADTSTSASSTAGPSASESLVGDTKSTVCQQIRAKVTTDTAAIGAALGRYVGYRSADSDDAAEDAREDATDAVKDLATDISHLGSAGADGSIRSAATAASSGIRALAASSDYFTDVDSLADIPGAINKIGAAAQPLADACR